MFIFGAGASFDSDPERRPGTVDFAGDEEFRPPLAAGLFTPASLQGREAIDAFPRAASLIMNLRQATNEGQDVEEVLEAIAETEADYPATAVELLAFRAYLARLLDEVPSRWLNECNGLTNYVRVLAEAARWNAAVHSANETPIACVTFNYDALLEDAVHRVFGHRLNDMNHYVTHPLVHVLKPHGSVHWRRPAGWDVPANHIIEGVGALERAIDQAPTLKWDETDSWAYHVGHRYQDPGDRTKVWLPALSIPVRRKTGFTMPRWHMNAMMEDLQKVTTVIAVGWRARERHFLQLLQDELPSAPSRLVAVAENDEAAQEAVDALWETGRFDRFAISGIGFSGFAETPVTPRDYASQPAGHTGVTLRDILTSDIDACLWTHRAPGHGLRDGSRERSVVGPRYVTI